MATIPRIHVNTPEGKKNIVDKLENKIMNNKTPWTLSKIGNLILNALVEIQLTNYGVNKKDNPEQYKTLYNLFKEENKEFTHKLLAPIISVQLTVGEIKGKENQLNEEILIHSNDNLCNMILGCKNTSSSFCEAYDKMTNSIFEDSISEERFQDLDDDWDTYDKCEIPRNFVNIKNMIYYDCCECNQEIYSQPNRSAREKSMCLECWRNS
jgi:hypothetical protein